jgi:hypothetical protein
MFNGEQPGDGLKDVTNLRAQIQQPGYTRNLPPALGGIDVA